MSTWERENAMYLPIDFYPATLAMGHLALSLSLPLYLVPHLTTMIVEVDLKHYRLSQWDAVTPRQWAVKYRDRV